MRASLLAAALVTTVAVSATANAEEKRTEWYGWQVLASDAATIATTAVLLNAHNNETYGQLNFTAGYFLGPSMIHLAHGNYAFAGASIAMRAGLPLAGGMTGCAVYGDRSDFLGCLPGAAIGMFLGMTAASTIDASALSYAEVRPRPKSFEVLPTASVSASGATFGLQGIF
jgi:hypothetical protein